MIGGEAQLDLACWQAVVFGLVGLDEVRGWSALEHLHKLVLIVPTIVHVEAAHSEVVDVLALCQHHDLTWCSSLSQLVDGILPEVGRHAVGHIAAETVDAHFDYPELHGINHGLAHVLIIIIEVSHVFPIPGLRTNNGICLGIVCVPIRVLFHPGMIPSRVVGHPVEDDSHPMLMADLGEVLEIVDGAELRCDGLVVADAVGRVLALLDADGVDRHHPHHVDAQIADGVDARSNGVERMVWCKDTGIHLIHGDILYCRHLECHLFSLLCWPAGNHCCQNTDGY